MTAVVSWQRRVSEQAVGGEPCFHLSSSSLGTSTFAKGWCPIEGGQQSLPEVGLHMVCALGSSSDPFVEVDPKWERFLKLEHLLTESNFPPATNTHYDEHAQSSPGENESRSQEHPLRKDGMISPSHSCQLFHQHSEDSDFKIGQLLVAFSLLSTESLESCLEKSRDLSMPLGSVLVSHNLISSFQLQWTIKLQSLLREGIISMSAALSIVDLMGLPKLSLERALNCVNYPEALNALKNCATRIGDFFIESGSVAVEDLEAAICFAKQSSLPVGRCLLILDLVSPAFLETVINAQRFVRLGRISKTSAVEALKQALVREKKSESCVYSTYRKQSVRLGELLVLAGIISETDVEYALEQAFASRMPIGAVLVQLGIISEACLNSALMLQDFVSEYWIGVRHAVYAMIDIYFKRYSLADSLDRFIIAA